MATICPIAIPEDLSSEAQLIMDSRGLFHFAWKWSEDFFTAHPRSASTDTASLITQTVTIPSGGNPTLSFMYRLFGAQAGGGGLTVSADANGVVSELFSTRTDTDGWAHQWIDMEPWQGQTMTLTFQLDQVAGMPAVTAYLDEVTLGNAYPDTWIALDAPTSVPPGRNSAAAEK